ncbi:hypothetical protein MMC26_002047 [Xylographa opegraphella]|nr:hypothetical protein [Xylographa opegraphella]
MSIDGSIDFPPFEDKDLGVLSPSLDHSFDNFFDQYFSQEEDFPDSSDNSNESNFFEDLSAGLSGDVSLDEQSATKASSPQYQPLHSWRANAWRQHKITPVPQSQKVVHRMRPDGVAISGNELLNLEGKAQLQQADLSTPFSKPNTPPYTPRRVKQSSRSGSPVTPTRSAHRVSKTSATPKMMRPSFYARQDSPLSAEWTERFQHFSLQTPPQNFPLSLSSSAVLPQQPQSSTLTLSDHDFEALSPISPTTVVQNSARIQKQSRVSAGNSYTPTMEETRNSSMWLSNSNFDFSADLQPDLTDFPQPLPLYEQELQSHSQTQMQSMDFLQMPTDCANQGLMIQCGPFDDPFQDMQPSKEYLASAFDPFHIDATIEEDERYSSELTPATTVPRMHNIQSQYRSQSPSPPNTPLHLSKSRRYSRHSRGKSSSCSTPKTPKTPKTPTVGVGAVGFVNYTPSDSRKILTGVAPSGSSKTKARREKEASDRRRKLSEAAAKAVMEAGGDVEALRKEGLLI